MPNDLSTLFDRIQALPDEELVDLLEQQADQYTREAISIAEIEAEVRGGMLHLKQEQALARLEQRSRQPLEQGKNLLEKLFSKLIGRPPSQKYPGLGYLSITLRLISFVNLLFAFISVVGGGYYFLADTLPSAEWWWNIGWHVGWQQPALLFLLFYGGSELINVVLDIEENTRGHDKSPQEDPKPPAEPA